MTSGDGNTGTAETLKAVPVRHPWRWVVAAVIAVLAAMLIHSMAVSTVDTRGVKHQPRWEWSIIGHYLFAAPILHGVARTALLTVVCMAIGIVLGTALAVMRLSPNPIVSGASWLYIWFFRGTPVLVQLIFWYYMAYLYPTISLGIPFGPSWVHIHTTTALSKFLAAMLGLGLNEAAYMAEIVRAGILSVDEGQTEAASALGMRRVMIMRRIVLPQAMRVIIPPTGNETISMLKTTSLVSVISYPDLLYAAQLIYSVNYKTIPLLLTVSIWYLAVTSLLYVGQYYLERHFARGSVRDLPRTPRQRLLTVLTSLRHAPPPAIEGVQGGDRR
ncbi:MAG TPA: amino acid ABC transporter permease [Mycobacteriales bacterium]|nr:amino acid ABC transporter permease [Mycobacteriales bacterium]